MNKIPILTVRHPGASMDAPFYTLYLRESDTSQLTYDPKCGTCLDKSLPREFEFEIREYDRRGYSGHVGSFPANPHTTAPAVGYVIGLANPVP